jgi:hypothetical protein
VRLCARHTDPCLEAAATVRGLLARSAGDAVEASPATDARVPLPAARPRTHAAG